MNDQGVRDERRPGNAGIKSSTFQKIPGRQLPGIFVGARQIYGYNIKFIYNVS
jgi:hypothetical protein